MLYIAALFASIVFLLIAIAGVVAAKMSPTETLYVEDDPTTTTTTTTTEFVCIPDGPDDI